MFTGCATDASIVHRPLCIAFIFNFVGNELRVARKNLLLWFTCVTAMSDTPGRMGHIVMVVPAVCHLPVFSSKRIIENAIIECYCANGRMLLVLKIVQLKTAGAFISMDASE